MIKRMLKKLLYISNIKIIDYLYYNFMSAKVEREKGVFLIPYKGAIIDLGRGTKIIIKGKNLQVGANRIGNSKAETYIRLMRGAKWNCKNGACLYYGTTIDLQSNAEMESGYFIMNTGSVIVAEKKITIGDDVLIGRDNVIYDSDFHPMLSEDGQVKNFPQEVAICDHVWLTNHVMIQKGVTINEGVVIGAYTVVRKNINKGLLISNGTEQICVASNIRWKSSRIQGDS